MPLCRAVVAVGRQLCESLAYLRQGAMVGCLDVVSLQAGAQSFQVAGLQFLPAGACRHGQGQMQIARAASANFPCQIHRQSAADGIPRLYAVRVEMGDPFVHGQLAVARPVPGTRMAGDEPSGHGVPFSHSRTFRVVWWAASFSGFFFWLASRQTLASCMMAFSLPAASWSSSLARSESAMTLKTALYVFWPSCLLSMASCISRSAGVMVASSAS